MASTTSLLEPTFNKPITSMTIAELRRTCRFFELPQTGITLTIRNRLQNFLTAHKQEMQHDYDYVALYPNRDPLPNRNQPADDAQDSQTFSQWNGIGGGEPAPANFPRCTPSVAARANDRVEQYLQGKPSHPHPLLFFPLLQYTSYQPHLLPCIPTRALHLALSSTIGSAEPH